MAHTYSWHRRMRRVRHAHHDIEITFTVHDSVRRAHPTATLAPHQSSFATYLYVYFVTFASSRTLR